MRCTPAGIMKPPAQKLLRKLARELYQTETLCMLHAKREAMRLKDSPPAIAMLDVARHADRTVALLPQLFESRAGSLGFFGAAFGFAFTTLRRLGLDWVFGPERSYRVTLLGQRHGIDLVYELQHLGRELNDTALVEWCQRWLEERVPLVTAVEKQLPWFVSHPDRAIASG
jgi:hypothetical protein